ncbi:MAG TPA: hypothetical protein VKY15_07585, partial [Acidimicrobiales bacterium]|nr:hypothetical protein [Acidimicrobiales bacterium]
FNESMYFNFCHPAGGLAGFLRCGNRVNEGYAEVTVCLWLPDGRVAFSFGRPPISGNQAFDAGGLRFEVLRPFEQLAVSYQGEVLVLEDPLAMADPQVAFSQSPRAPAKVELAYRAVSAVVGGEPEQPLEPEGEEFARGHYEQLVGAVGQVEVAGLAWEVDAYGLRDHSWGPRHWQAPWYYRWLTACFGEDLGFMAARIARRSGPGTRGGFLWDGRQVLACDHLELSTTWEGPDHYHRELHGVLKGPAGEWRFSGSVVSLVPLRNRRSGALTRISEGLTRWTLEGGRVGYGLSEYLDQIVDGLPVGLRE